VKVSVQCSNPTDIRLEVRAELLVGEWEKILALVQHGQPSLVLYEPLRQLLLAVKRGVDGVRNREVVCGAPPAGGAL
jgi:hypothetical protein